MIRRQRPHPCDPRPRALAECAPRSAGGATAVEFAIVAPVLLMLLFGILVYGGYFLMSHSVQQLANDAARAAVGGMTDAERQQLAAGTLASELPTYGYLSPASTQLADPHAVHHDRPQRLGAGRGLLRCGAWRGGWPATAAARRPC
jgi:hypothetical protein